MRASAASHTPFFAVVWFHSPHEPTLATNEYRAMYSGATEEQRHYWGSITAMDAQIGRLRAALRELRVERETMLWYCSDNGPARVNRVGPGVTKGLRGHKGTLFEGGIRVPGLLEWPGFTATREVPRVIHTPCSTSDYFPTILKVVGLPLPDDRPYDGIDLLPILREQPATRPIPLTFQHFQDAAVIVDKNKLILSTATANARGRPPELYDLVADAAESHNIALESPELVDEMTGILRDWQHALPRSR
jgi:arylsulfatase A-like enzyme